MCVSVCVCTGSGGLIAGMHPVFFVPVCFLLFFCLMVPTQYSRTCRTPLRVSFAAGPGWTWFKLCQSTFAELDSPSPGLNLDLDLALWIWKTQVLGLLLFCWRITWTSPAAGFEPRTGAVMPTIHRLCQICIEQNLPQVCFQIQGWVCSMMRFHVLRFIWSAMQLTLAVHVCCFRS